VNIRKALILLSVVMAVFAGSMMLSRSLRAEDGELSSKLEEIADNQKRILAEIQAIKEELNIIKIRITQNQ
jgi:hypothetical protein